MRQELSFWVAVGLIAIAAVVLLKLAAGSTVGDKIPGLRPLADTIA